MTNQQGDQPYIPPHEIAAYLRGLEGTSRDRREVGQFESHQGARQVHREIHVTNGETHVTEDIVEFFDTNRGDAYVANPSDQQLYNAWANQRLISRIFGIK